MKTEQIKVEPQPGGQVNFLRRREFEVGFGGQAGPGKSWGIVADALGLQFIPIIGKASIEVPEYRAVLFRRKTTQLSQLLSEAKRYYTAHPLNAEFAAQRRGEPGPSFTFPSGAQIFLCHMQHEDNKEDHQGVEYQYVGFDELTHFTVTQYSYLFSRLRSTIPGLFPRIRSTFNWTGPGLVWVRKRFWRNGTLQMNPGQTYHFAQLDAIDENPGGTLVDRDHPQARTRTFIPGKLDENKILIENDPSYKQGLLAMGPKMARALLHGDPDAFTGDFFDDFSGDLAVEPFDIPDNWELFGSIDPGWSSPCSFGLQARSPDGEICRLFTYYAKGKSPQQHAEDINSRIINFPYTGGRMPSVIVSGRDAFARKDRYAIVNHEMTFSDIFEQHGLYLEPATTDRVNGWWAWKNEMRGKRWQYFDGFNDSLVEEILAAQHDEKDPEDIQGRGNDSSVPDHALDEARYAIMAITKGNKKKPKRKRRKSIFDVEPKKDHRKIW